jgi:L-ascorbate metabolism protein UlaG (beta-lactamase superfamily)
MKKKQFENLSPTPQLAEDVSVLHVLRAFSRRPPHRRPSSALPSVKTDLKTYYTKEPSIIWFGHSSYLIHADGKNFLVDPVLGGHASPFFFMIKAFEGSDPYKVGDMPEIDYLILTHNHYDHLDYKALRSLVKKTKRFIMPVGVSENLRGLGINETKVKELKWGDSFLPESGISIDCTPARHFSGRGLKRNYSLWCSYVLKINEAKIFIGGDSGYDFHFREIGNKYGPFDIALLECGQYDKMWPYIHSFPEQAVKEGEELKAKAVMPIHWGKFALANHNWQEPIDRFVKEAEKRGVKYTTPLIGEPVVLGKSLPQKSWWRL